MPRLLGLTGRLRASGNVGGARPRRGRSSYVLSVDHSKPCFENSPVLLALSLPDAGESYEHNCQAIHNGDRPDEGKPSPAPEVKSTAEPPLSPRPRLAVVEFPVKWRSSNSCQHTRAPGACEARGRSQAFASSSPTDKMFNTNQMHGFRDKTQRTCDTTLRSAVLSEIGGIFQFP
jgi:hypothetical protein